jgi:gamma-D-glutamyl-L-lysine dipeptidyl-peptidase
MNERVVVAIAPLRREASDKSEMVSQALMGEELLILERQQKWSMIRLLNDGYEGWLDNKQFGVYGREEAAVVLSVPITRCVNDKGEVIWLPAASTVPQSWALGESQQRWSGDAAGIEQCARTFLNAPYLWGGRTILGMDCSGLTQLVMRLNGISIPRDAYQQAEMGVTISFVEESQTGDLAFFDNAEGRIIHVGIIIRNADGIVEIIHASGKVRVDALDHQGIFNREQSAYSHKLRIIKRIV